MFWKGACGFVIVTLDTLLITFGSVDDNLSAYPGNASYSCTE